MYIAQTSVDIDAITWLSQQKTLIEGQNARHPKAGRSFENMEEIARMYRREPPTFLGDIQDEMRELYESAGRPYIPFTFSLFRDAPVHPERLHSATRLMMRLPYFEALYIATDSPVQVMIDPQHDDNERLPTAQHFGDFMAEGPPAPFNGSIYTAPIGSAVHVSYTTPRRFESFSGHTLIIRNNLIGAE